MPQNCTCSRGSSMCTTWAWRFRMFQICRFFCLCCPSAFQTHVSLCALFGQFTPSSCQVHLSCDSCVFWPTHTKHMTSVAYISLLTLVHYVWQARTKWMSSVVSFSCRSCVVCLQFKRFSCSCRTQTDVLSSGFFLVFWQTLGQAISTPTTS